MNKELDEAWTTIYHYNEEIIHDMGSEYVENPLKEEIDIVNNALLELKAIKEANPSKALENITLLAGELGTSKDVKFAETRFPKMLITIQQYILKAQEMEKVLEIIKEKNVDVFRFKKLDFNTFNQLQRSCKLPELTPEEFNLLKEMFKSE